MSRCDFFDGRYLLRCFLLDPRTPQKSSQRKRLCQASLKLMFELPTQNEEAPPFKNAPPELQRLNSLSLPAPLPVTTRQAVQLTRHCLPARFRDPPSGYGPGVPEYQHRSGRRSIEPFPTGCGFVIHVDAASDQVAVPCERRAFLDGILPGDPELRSATRGKRLGTREKREE